MKNKAANVKPKFVNARKALRKEKRKLKKQHRQEHYSKRTNVAQNLKNSGGRFVRRPDNESDERDKFVNKKMKVKNQPLQDLLFKQQQKEKNEAKKLMSQMEKQRKKILLKANEEEDKIIKKLEKQLGMNKTKNKNNFFSDDGLDYLLEICDRTTSEQIVAAEKHLADVEKDSDFEEDLALVTGKESAKKRKRIAGNNKDKEETISDSEYDETIESDKAVESDEVMESDENMESGDMYDDSNSDRNQTHSDITDDEISDIEQHSKHGNSIAKLNNIKPVKVISEDDIKNVLSEDGISHLSYDDEDNTENNQNNPLVESENPVKENIWEDIYGRKRDKDGNIIKEEKGVYIPPHLRNKDTTSDKELIQLRRQIKSVLNKLAGTNLYWACTSIENLYLNNSRNSVNTALSQLWLEALVGNSLTPDRMVAEHAALVSVLHANIGSEIGAHFLEVLSRRFDEMMQTNQPVEDKRLDNLVTCLAQLFGFKIYHVSLLYDILGRLVVELSEKSIDCVLCVLRSVGGAVRRDEPAALKAFIHDTQTRLANMTSTAADGSRIKYLLEVLMAVKNNNFSKIPNYDGSYAEELRKACRGIVRRGNYVTPLHIRLEDLLKAHERGKWWVVGSAWEGQRRTEEKTADKPLPTQDTKLLELARKQRMNTDVRRSIFCVIMAAEDYMDAFEKLQHLGLRGQQEREVVHVLMACCLHEKVYNPYYAVLAQKLCDYDRKYQLSIQYSVWDKIKEMDSLPKLSVTNLAQFLTHLIMEKGLPLTVLKIIQFSDLNKRTVRFMRQILLAIIMNEDLQASLQVFHRISKPPKLHMFRESLRLFIQHFLIKNAGNKSSVLSEDEMETLKQRAVEVDKILTLNESKLRL